jgi:hypothetical protein
LCDDVFVGVAISVAASAVFAAAADVVAAGPAAVAAVEPERAGLNPPVITEQALIGTSSTMRHRTAVGDSPSPG